MREPGSSPISAKEGPHPEPVAIDMFGIFDFLLTNLLQ